MSTDADGATRPEYLKTYTEEAESFGSIESIKMCEQLAGVESIDDLVEIALDDQVNVLDMLNDIVLYWNIVKQDEEKEKE